MSWFDGVMDNLSGKTRNTIWSNCDLNCSCFHIAVMCYPPCQYWPLLYFGYCCDVFRLQGAIRAARERTRGGVHPWRRAGGDPVPRLCGGSQRYPPHCKEEFFLFSLNHFICKKKKKAKKEMDLSMGKEQLFLLMLVFWLVSNLPTKA